MAEPTSGRVTGLAVDPSDPSRAGELFRFNLDLMAERAEDDPNRPGDAFVFKSTTGGESNTFGGYADGFTGGVYVASHGTGLSYFESALPAVQFEAVIDDFANAQPAMGSDDLSYSNSFECIPASVP